MRHYFSWHGWLSTGLFMWILLLGMYVFSCLSCAHNVEYTHCGVAVETTEWLTLKDVQQAELEVLIGVLDSSDTSLWDVQKNCDRLRGTYLSGRDVSSWWYKDKNGDEINITGLTSCGSISTSVEVARPNKDNWRMGAIPHELVHVLQGCNGHYRWEEDGIQKMLLDIYTKKDN